MAQGTSVMPATLAAIHDLIAQMGDARLRKRLAAA